MKKMVLSAMALALMSLTGGAAQAQELAGVYVECPDKDEAACAAADAVFREEFPTGQPGPYILIRKDGGGYLAPDDRSTVDLKWELAGDNTYTFRIKDQAKTKYTMALNDQHLRNVKTGAVYYRSLSDSDWNQEPVPFKQKQKQMQKKAKAGEKK